MCYPVMNIPATCYYRQGGSIYCSKMKLPFDSEYSVLTTTKMSPLQADLLGKNCESLENMSCSTNT